jgi:hypothetical protein
LDSGLQEEEVQCCQTCVCARVCEMLVCLDVCMPKMLVIYCDLGFSFPGMSSCNSSRSIADNWGLSAVVLKPFMMAVTIDNWGLSAVVLKLLVMAI